VNDSIFVHFYQKCLIAQATIDKIMPSDLRTSFRPCVDIVRVSSQSNWHFDIDNWRWHTLINLQAETQYLRNKLDQYPSKSKRFDGYIPLNVWHLTGRVIQRAKSLRQMAIHLRMLQWLTAIVLDAESIFLLSKGENCKF